ncbi:hypothetical protein F0224_06520 [Vibrio coralliilyticus]|uniref:hypothetical protein n=1 Tax=Vibrio coralliilyticus TaxID=190893 RepID=UPI000BAC1B21|nr:hypothetical protein [Vibrio coralliilyticus]NOI75326.1 hypothetical protein [Vibrio coralliilyticus]PAW04158.1 hypothetical protein CKJ79_05330 [Vibrio coralliilyticus]
MSIRSFSSVYIWLHSSFAAISVAFFLSLLSASSQTQVANEIVLSGFFFSISLVLNSGLAFTLVWFEESELVNRLYPLFPWQNLKSLPSVAILTFLTGLLCFLSFYSFWFAVAALVAGSIIYIKVGTVHHQLIEEVVEAKAKRKY